MLEVGTNTYVTVQEANSYIIQHYMSHEEEYTLWFEQSTLNRSTILRRAANNLERLPYVGKKSKKVQQLAFPRWPEVQVPLAVGYAQIEEALALLLPETQDTLKETQERIRRGLRSYSIGQLSESFRVHDTTKNVLNSLTAQELLAPYLSGGYRI